MNWKQQLSKYGLLLFPVSLALPIALNYKSAALVIFFSTLLLNTEYFRFFNISNYKNKLAILFALFFITEPLVNFIRENSFNFNDVRLSFLVAPILFFVSKDVLIKRKRLIMNAFVCGVYFYIIYAIFYTIYFYGIYNPLKPFALDYYLKYVLYNYLPGAIHHTYIGMYISFAMSILLFEVGLDTKRKIYLVTPMFVALFFLGSKLSILIATLLLIFWLGRSLSTHNRKIITSTSIFLLFGMLFYGIYYTDLFRTLANSFYTRISFFECSIQGIEQNWLLGIGRENIKPLIADCLSDSIGMDVHNIFLQEFLSTGVFGLIVLFLLLWTLLVESTKNLILKLFLIMFVLFGQVEHLFNTQLGVTYFVFFSLLLQFGENTNGVGNTTSKIG